MSDHAADAHRSPPMFIHRLESIAELSGRVLAWLTLAIAILTALVVLLRYWFGLGGVALQEAIIYCHALVFWLGAAYTLKHDEHVRVDIFYRRFSSQARAWVNCLGCIFFLWPLCFFIFLNSLDFVASAWRIAERSSEAGGLPFVFLLKSIIPLGALMLALQGLAAFCRNASLLIYPQHCAGAEP